MHSLCENGKDDEFCFEMGNTKRKMDGQTDTHTHTLRQRKEMRDSEWRSKALTHGSLESASLLDLPWGTERQERKW